MIIRKSFYKFATKKAFLLGTLSLTLIGSGAIATQASFRDTGSTTITGTSSRLVIWDWGLFEAPIFDDVALNEPKVASSTFSNLCNCNIEAVAKLNPSDVADPAILDATTIMMKINGTTIYNGSLRYLSSTPIRLGPNASVPIEVTITVDSNRLNQNQIINSVPIKFLARSVPSL